MTEEDRLLEVLAINRAAMEQIDSLLDDPLDVPSTRMVLLIMKERIIRAQDLVREVRDD